MCGHGCSCTITVAHVRERQGLCCVLEHEYSPHLPLIRSAAHAQCVQQSVIKPWRCVLQGKGAETQELFNTTYKGLRDTLNQKKKAGIKYDFGAEAHEFESRHQLDSLAFFQVCTHC